MFIKYLHILFLAGYLIGIMNFNLQRLQHSWQDLYAFCTDKFVFLVVLPLAFYVTIIHILALLAVPTYLNKSITEAACHYNLRIGLLSHVEVGFLLEALDQSFSFQAGAKLDELLQTCLQL